MLQQEIIILIDVNIIHLDVVSQLGNVADNLKLNLKSGHDGGQVVSELAFSNDPSVNPAEVCKFFCSIIVGKDENKQIEARIGPTTIT